MTKALEQHLTQRRKGAKVAAPFEAAALVACLRQLKSLKALRQTLLPKNRSLFASFAPLREAFAPLREVFVHGTTANARSRFTCVTVLLLAFALLVGCQSHTAATEKPDSTKLSQQVTAASYPLAYFAERLLGDSIEIQTLTPPAQSTKPWRPSRAEILSMQKSDIIFVNGSAAPFATWLPHVTLPDSKICATANDGLKLSDMIAVEDVRIVHSHGPEGEHSHPTMVAYTWLDPTMAAKQVAVMASKLTSTYPELESSIATEQRRLTTELESSAEIIDAFHDDDTGPCSVLIDTPKLKFLTRAFGLIDFHLNWEQPPNAIDAEAQLKEKLSSATPRPEFMLFTDEPTPELRLVAESLDLQVIIVNPMKHIPVDSDYIRVMIDNLNQLEPVLEIKTDAAKRNVTDSEQN